ncbi:MAG: hypothetical protein AB4368_14130 [Xenococcaceae cyanobacterium]
MPNLTLTEVFGSGAVFDETAGTLTINLEGLNWGLPNPVIEVYMIDDTSIDDNVGRILWAIISRLRILQPDTNNDNERSLYVTSQGKRTVTRNNVSQSLYCTFTLYDYDGIPGNTHVITGYNFPPTYLEITGKLESKWLAYKVEKKAWIERLEVVGFAYNFSSIGILDISRNIFEFFSPIDSSCFNVYVTNNTEDLIIPPIAPTGYVEPMFPWETELKYQICNENKNEPLKFYVTCGCESEICPPGTCKVDCGDHICCYDSNGIAVAEIRLEQLS